MADAVGSAEPAAHAEDPREWGTPTSDGAAACFPPTDVLCTCHHVPTYCCPNEPAAPHADDPLRHFLLDSRGADGGGSDSDHASPDEGCFAEREQALKERFLALEEGGRCADEAGDEQLLSFLAIDDETEEERREREYRHRRQQQEEEDRLAELDALQAIYARASKRAFRRLKNLPEPPPGCTYTGCGEEEEEEPPGSMYPGEGEETGEQPDPPYCGIDYPLPAPSPGAVVSRLRRRRRSRFRQEAAAAVAPAPDEAAAASDSDPLSSKACHLDTQAATYSPQCCASIAPAPPARTCAAEAAVSPLTGAAGGSRRPYPADSTTPT
eukprot:TRINITY_DN10528_c0_g2_i1.p1 TRINITY_DN10528_c0_g2~~TRINITY_DN10528_c0_g2_i1.p1  ORF type:complete len:325 (+),score=104.99 TRINITY_DN10528_c0_g2_i1:247-1221(+)